MIENQLERSELLKIWRILDEEITDIISYIDDNNTGMLQQYQGDTTSVEFERDLEGKEEVLPELEDKSDKIWDEIQELKEQFESIKNETL